MSSSKTNGNDRKQRIINLTLASIAGQVGCLTLVIILGAVLLGLWLDAQFQSKPLITIILLVASIPISLGLMFFIVRQAVARIKPGAPEKKSDHAEEADLGKNS